MLPKPARNTATREYFQPNKAIDSSSQSIDWPEDEDDYSSSPSSKSPTGKSSKSKELTPSPTPSDEVLSADMSEVGALGELNKKLMGEGMGAKERKEKVLEKKEELERLVEEGRRIGEKEGMEGKGKGKWKRKE